MDILAKIQTIIKTNYPQVKINVNVNTVLGDIDFLDSLELATIAVELENEYNFRFPDEELENLKTKSIKEIISIIENTVKQK